MARRRHLKSRYGCVECKRRRVKCDETRPACLNCSISRRQCSYSSLAPRIPGHPIAASLATSDAESSVSSPGHISFSPRSETSPIFHQGQATPSGNVDDGDVSAEAGLPANIPQLELLHHFLSSPGIGIPVRFSMGNGQDIVKTIVEKGLSCDYLMNEILAFSARHLAQLRPERCALYTHQAKQFQTHALGIFTRAQVTPMADNCLSILFFSWLLGTHLMCDLTTAEDDLSFMEQFYHYIDMYRGIRAVTSDTWKFLMESEYRSLFQDGEAVAKELGTGSQSCCLRDLIRDSLGLSDAERAGATDALARVQWAFDAHDEAGLAAALPKAFNMVFAWPLIVTPDFVSSLRRRRPESLLVLAYFAVLLHWCRDHWVLCQTGGRLLRSVESGLGQGWERWLQWPKDMIEKEDSR